MRRSIFLIYILNVFLIFLFFALAIASLVFEFNDKLATAFLERLFATAHLFKLVALGAFSIALLSTLGLYYSTSRNSISIFSKRNLAEIDLKLVKRILQRHFGKEIVIQDLFLNGNKLQIGLIGKIDGIEDFAYLERQIRDLLIANFDYGHSFKLHLYLS